MKKWFQIPNVLRNDEGAVAVEFSILIPLFIAAVLSLSDISGAAVERMRMERALNTASMLVEQNMIRPGAYDDALQDIVAAMLEGAPASEVVVVDEPDCTHPGQGKGTDKCGGKSKNLKMSLTKNYSSRFIGDFEITSVLEVQTQ